MGFDIVRQTYACASCGSLSGIQETKETILHWRTLRKQNLAVNSAGITLEKYSCPACGAQIVFESGEASETCDFCGSRLIRAELTDEEQMPDMIIPFFITAKEARKRMLEWGHEHGKTPEGRAVVSSMSKFKGYYLPYQLVRGSVYASITRDGSKRRYRCAGYLEGTAVSTSNQFDNSVLNGMEPFDWSAVRPFEYGYVAGQNIKLSNLAEKQIERRILDETAADFLPEVERVMQSSGVNIEMSCENLMGFTVLLPVYFIKSGKLTAVMNGQTGRIAVSRNRKKKSNPWVVEPLVYTLIATGLISIPYHFQIYYMGLFAFVFAAIFFSVMGEGRHSLLQRITLRTEAAKAKREKGELKVEEGNDILKNSYDNTPVFYEKSTSQKFFDRFRPGYGAAWYAFAGLITVIYFAKGVRKDVYDHPLLYETASGGREKLATHASGKLSIFSVLGIQRQNENGERVSLFKAFRMLGGPGIFLGGFLVFLLAGSVAAILM